MRICLSKRPVSPNSKPITRYSRHLPHFSSHQLDKSQNHQVAVSRQQGVVRSAMSGHQLAGTGEVQASGLGAIVAVEMDPDRLPSTGPSLHTVQFV